MKTQNLTETQKAQFLLDLKENMEGFIDSLPDEHPIGYIPENMAELMSFAALNVVLTVNNTNVYFSENE